VANLWIVYREGLRLIGAIVGQAPLPMSIARLDIAPWRLFTTERPDLVPLEQVQQSPARKRALLEVGQEDRYELCGLTLGFFESPYSPEECLRRLHLGADVTSASP